MCVCVCVSDRGKEATRFNSQQSNKNTRDPIKQRARRSPFTRSDLTGERERERCVYGKSPRAKTDRCVCLCVCVKSTDIHHSVLRTHQQTKQNKEKIQVFTTGQQRR
ncbi:hypothetical protein E3U43_015757 [Larimichthys crocea]|uniref:Uncharacterized protein n=1 Tax=Larimichthys crocea TaxID=215358 RepID=A0ACD3RSV3_LARCR|nr:hypothetical protein E3U43_015757 [Larimichthys crocea]